jgi:hypothetical protein
MWMADRLGCPGFAGRQCRARGDFLCFTDRDVLVLVGVPAAAVLVGGLLVIAVVGKIVEVARRLRT